MPCRTLFLLFLGCLLASCSTPDHVQREVIVKGFNFSPYTSTGFLFTPLSPTGDYESIGLVSVSIQPEIMKGKSQDVAPTGGEAAPKGYVGAWYGGKRYWVEDVRPADVIEEMYNLSPT